jgi:putative tryptophan/tyrosine transport system substrate-binding protein
MRRREVLVGLGGATICSLRAHAQQPEKTYRVGIVEPISAELNTANLGAFRQGLRDLGYVERRNLILEYRSADGDASRFPALISELIGLNVDLIVTRGTPAALAAKKATSTIPVVMASLGEPLLVVESLARPGGNITGMSGVVSDLDAKRVELLLEIAPTTSGLAAVLNLSNPITVAQLHELERAVQPKGLRFKVFDVRGREDIERAFDSAKNDYDAVTVGLEAVTQRHRHRIAELAVIHRLPVIYGGREFVEAGGLISYAPTFTDIYRRAATYVDKIFKGSKPADLPVEQPTKFELLINLKTANALGLKIPPTLLARADEVIE